MTKQDRFATSRLIEGAVPEIGPSRDWIMRAARIGGHLPVLCLLTSAIAFGQSFTVMDANNNNNPITQGSIIYLPKDDSGAAFTFNVDDPFDYLSVDVTFQYTDQAGRRLENDTHLDLNNGTYTANLPGLGGSAIVAWVDPCGVLVGNMSFTVMGTNPDPGQVDTFLATGLPPQLQPPWFFYSVLAHEDRIPGEPNAYRQYADSTWPNNRNIVGMALWGYPDGIGMSQYEAKQNSATYWDYFSWQSNLADGVNFLITQKLPPANTFWQNQLNASTYDPPPTDDPGFACDFGFSYPPLPGWDYLYAEWMTAYNGTGGQINRKTGQVIFLPGYFISWSQQGDQTGPQWNILQYPLAYVYAVCNTAPI